MNWTFFINKWTAIVNKPNERTEYLVEYDQYFDLHRAYATRTIGFTVQHSYLGAFREVEDAKQQAELFDSDPIKNPAKITFDVKIGEQLSITMEDGGSE